MKKHGKKRRMFAISMPKKVRLLAMKTLLSARLAEGRIIIIDTDTIEERKTKHVVASLENFSEKETYLLITSQISEDFFVASKNVQRIEYVEASKVTISQILRKDKLLVTIDGMLDIMRLINERTVIRHKPVGQKFTPVLHSQILEPERLKRAEKHAVG